MLPKKTPLSTFQTTVNKTQLSMSTGPVISFCWVDCSTFQTTVNKTQLLSTISTGPVIKFLLGRLFNGLTFH